MARTVPLPAEPELTEKERREQRGMDTMLRVMEVLTGTPKYEEPIEAPDVVRYRYDGSHQLIAINRHAYLPWLGAPPRYAVWAARLVVVTKHAITQRTSPVRPSHQRNTTVFVPLSTTRCSTCHFTARASVTHSTSRPIAVS